MSHIVQIKVDAPISHIIENDLIEEFKDFLCRQFPDRHYSAEEEEALVERAIYLKDVISKTNPNKITNYFFSRPILFLERYCEIYL